MPALRHGLSSSPHDRLARRTCNHDVIIVTCIAPVVPVTGTSSLSLLTCVIAAHLKQLGLRPRIKTD